MAGTHGNRKSRRKQLSVSHQKNWLIGRYAVLEALRAGKWPVDDLYVSKTGDKDAFRELLSLARTQRVPTTFVSDDRITELCHARHHQGCAARMGAFPYDSEAKLFNSCASACAGDGPPPVVFVCDRIQDTFNFGAILRCCDAMAVLAVVVGITEQATVTPQVARSSAGAVNHVSIVQSDELSACLIKLKEFGFRIAAASEKSDAPSWSIDLNGPVALVVGNEAQGISEQLQDVCDVGLRIPMSGGVSSLNAAVAAGILLYEVRRQQNREH